MKQLITLGVAACLAWNILPAEAAVSGAPAPPTEMVVTFPEGSLEGYVAFKAPQLTVGGAELNGNLKYEITVEGEADPIASGEVYPGVEKSVDVRMPKKGVYQFAVTVANLAGKSDPAKFRAGAGYIPAAAPVAKAEVLADGKVKVSWEAVTRDMKGTSIAGEAVTYRVERYPDGHYVALNTPELSVIDDNLDGKAHSYRYYVMAIYNSTPGDEAYTNPVVVGIADVPFTCNFNTLNETDLFTAYDLDGDGNTWVHYNGAVRAGSGNKKAADDWLISPAINLKKNATHPVSIDICQHMYAGDQSKVEICYGPKPEPASMTYVAIPTVIVTSTTYQTFSGLAKADWDGPVYFGIHNITEPDQWYCVATNFKVDASTADKVPAPVTDLKGISDINGALKAEISFTAPEVDLNNNRLDNIQSIEVYRDGKLIKTFGIDEAVVPGQHLSFTDEAKVTPDPENGIVQDKDDLTQGTHNYSVIANNQHGSGLEAKLTLFVGINLPASPGAARAYETDVNGIVTIEWEPVTTYIDGTPLNPENVTYCIWTNVTGQNMKLLDQLKGTSHTFRIIEPELSEPDQKQLFFQFGITAETSYGENTLGVLTEYVPLGDPHAAPYEDSFPDLRCGYSYVMGGSDIHSFMDNGSDRTFEELESMDGDNGMIYMYGEGYGSSAYLMTGKIDLKGLEAPMATFYVHNYWDEAVKKNDNTVELFIADIAGKDEWKSLGVWTLKDFETEGWHRIAAPLDEYKDKQVRLKIVGTIYAYNYMHFDNLQVRSRHNYDMALISYTVPERIKSGNECPITVTYGNYGLKDAGEFSIEVLQDGTQVAEKTFASMPTDGRAEVTLSVLHSSLTPETVTYDVLLTYGPDRVNANNSFDSFEVKTIPTPYPPVTDLAANYGDRPEELTLVWSEPDMSQAVVDERVDDFEDCDAWDTEVDGWTFVDMDRQLIYGFGESTPLPGFAPKPQSRQSWWVCDGSYQPLMDSFSDPQYYKAHSGNKYIISMAVTDEDYESQKSDDWAISPELPGMKQTISFWAKAMLADCQETFDFLYSTTDKEIESFKRLQTVKNVGWYWTQYFFEIPEGAKYFAIRATSREQFVLMIDDINYIPNTTGSDLKIGGYNVYRDHKLLGKTEPKVTSYKDTRASSADMPVYNVTAVYEGRGESVLSNDAKPEWSSVQGVTAAVSVRAAHGQVRIEGAEGLPIRIYAADGTLAASEIGAQQSVFSLMPGIYVVQIADATWKVYIR